MSSGELNRSNLLARTCLAWASCLRRSRFSLPSHAECTAFLARIPAVRMRVPTGGIQANVHEVAEQLSSGPGQTLPRVFTRQPGHW